MDDSLKFTFYITYVMLVTTGTITLIEALRTPDPMVRHIMNVETCVSIVAAFFYNTFIKLQDIRDIEKLRYTDWFITTPLMLLGLMLILARNNQRAGIKTGNYVSIYVFVLVVFADVCMLASGYLNRNNKVLGTFLGFIFYLVLFGTLAYFYVLNGTNINAIIFGIFALLWALYGVAYNLKVRYMNIMYNILDLLAKCLMGIFFWAYFTRLVRL